MSYYTGTRERQSGCRGNWRRQFPTRLQFRSSAYLRSDLGENACPSPVGRNWGKARMERWFKIEERLPLFRLGVRPFSRNMQTSIQMREHGASRFSTTTMICGSLRRARVIGSPALKHGLPRHFYPLRWPLGREERGGARRSQRNDPRLNHKCPSTKSTVEEGRPRIFFPAQGYARTRRELGFAPR